MVEYMDRVAVQKTLILPVAIKAEQDMEAAAELLIGKTPCVSFRREQCCVFTQKGAYVVLDFGKELCGGVRLITSIIDGAAKFRITLGESLSEACADLRQKNATNDHSPRDFEAVVPLLSDLTFGMSGFRFARLELLTEKPVYIRNIFAVNTLPVFEKEGWVKTDDGELNHIIDTAAYTLKLNMQNGYIWDGIKRDRLVWSGDLHQEIVLASYLYGDVENIPNALTFLKEETPPTKWINGIPTYSAWWVINLCDYCRLTGNGAYFQKNRDYALAVMENLNRCVDEKGEMDFSSAPSSMPYFLDWPTFKTEDAKIGTASLFVYMANKYLEQEENDACREIAKKLSAYLDMDCQYKQTRAFQILAGRDPAGEAAFLEKDGAAGLSTFMAYYILKADAMAGGKNMYAIIKEYFGGMLSRGATSFWEDFDVAWLEGSGRIDEFPEEGQKDIHGDYGAFCYIGFRHSLCHGWASGVLAFIIEQLLGAAKNESGIHKLEAELFVGNRWQKVQLSDEKMTIE